MLVHHHNLSVFFQILQALLAYMITAFTFWYRLGIESPEFRAGWHSGYRKVCIFHCVTAGEQKSKGNSWPEAHRSVCPWQETYHTLLPESDLTPL